MEYSVEPTEEALLNFLDESVSNKPIVMVNMLRFREQANYGDSHVHTSACSGREAYDRYSKGVMPLLLEVGGAPIWIGSVRNTFIAPTDERWDQVLLVAYPSRAAFVKMVSTQAYADIMVHRTAALLDSRLIETQPKRFPKTILKVIGFGFRAKAILMHRNLANRTRTPSSNS